MDRFIANEPLVSSLSVSNGQNTSQKGGLFTLFSIILLIIILMLALGGIFYTYKNSKNIKKIINDYESRIINISNDIYSIKKKFNDNSSLFKEIINKNDSHKSNIINMDIENRLKNIEKHISNNQVSLKNENSGSFTDRDNDRPNDTRGYTDDPVALFNSWAANPKNTLPSSFRYLVEEPKLRINQTFSETDTDTETKWIINKFGIKKYIFPNPNFFNLFTETSLYKIDAKLLKPKGQNRIKIVKPCLAEDSGFISYPGVLDFL